MVESREDEHEPARDARFEPPPEAVEPRVAGRIALSSSSNAELARLAASMCFAGLTTLLVVLTRAPLEVWQWLPLAVAPTAVWGLAARTRRAELSWDAWGLTLDEAGARTAIAWSAARVYVLDERYRRTLQVFDDEGRVISVIQGGAPDLSSEPRQAMDARALVEATRDLPRSPEPFRPEAHASTARTLLGTALMIAVVLAIAVALDRPLIGVASVVVLSLCVLPLRDVSSAWARARAMRGARAMSVTGDAGGLLRGQLESAPVALRVAETIADARVGERGEPVHVVLASGPERGVSSPYRGTEGQLAVRALETEGARAARRRRLASGLGRLGIGIATIAAWLALLPAATPSTAGSVRPISTLDAPPEPPRARPIAPRPPSDPSADARAVRRWRASGPHFEWTRECRRDRDCAVLQVYVDPASGTRIVCDDAHRAECARLRRAHGLPFDPMPPPELLPERAPH